MVKFKQSETKSRKSHYPQQYLSSLVEYIIIIFANFDIMLFHGTNFQAVCLN